MPTLSSPLNIGTMTLAHRIVMAPMTRLRSDSYHVPHSMVVDYYSQRASSGGLLITEATFISHSSCGRDANAPGIYTKAQIEAWRRVTNAVHAKGGYITMQLWHVGRAARPAALAAEGLEMVSSSAVPIPPRNGEKYATPRPMTEDEIWQSVAEFAQAARNAVVEAGFDAVEIHAANGYLIDQFLQDTCNQRTDQWGGSVENRSRFCVEVTKAVCNAIGPERTGVRLCPYGQFQGMGMNDPIPQFTDLISRLRPLRLGYLHLIEPRVSGNIDRDVKEQENLDFAFKAWNHAGPVLLAGGYTPKTAKKVVEENHREDDVAIAFGRHFVSNPDLPFRVLNCIPLTHYDRETFYKTESPDGYIDYAFSKEWCASQMR
ncbi:hypothetical protein H2198_001923 [Neophaeococcomyces mojaviensis]|uniref:Uncharacterized protein n=1 Tax=Neophaeococcomyces mojaviensis TaxID=3383035 RepID=A0ACC3AFQ4_9EURO|nr:hypothetical protein H2198_001923 [Knufia sp. JES_112]